MAAALSLRDEYSNILGGGAIFSKLNDLISSARVSFLRLTRARLVRCTVYVSIIGHLHYCPHP